MKTRAALFHAVGTPLEVVELDLDEPRPHEVVVRMTAVGICGTDLHQVKGEFRRPTPMVLGHEGAGIVEEVGDAVDVRAAGRRGRPLVGALVRRVRRLPARTAGNVQAPQRGDPERDAAGRHDGDVLRGETVYRGTATGCLAERVVVTEQVALPLRNAVPLDQAALLGCAVLTGVGAVLYAAQVTAGASVLVIGAGGVGQFVVQGARIAGAATIVASDPVPARLEAARAAGATHVVAPDDLREALRAEVPDGRGLRLRRRRDPETVETALRSTRDGGTTVIVGLPPQGLRLDLDPFELIRKEKRLTGTLYGSEDPAVSLPAMLEHVKAGRLELAGSLGPSFPLDRVDDAVQASLAGEPAGSSSCPSRLAQERVALRGDEAVAAAKPTPSGVRPAREGGDRAAGIRFCGFPLRGLADLPLAAMRQLRRRSRRLQGCAPPAGRGSSGGDPLGGSPLRGASSAPGSPPPAARSASGRAQGAAPPGRARRRRRTSPR